MNSGEGEQQTCGGALARHGVDLVLVLGLKAKANLAMLCKKPRFLFYGLESSGRLRIRKKRMKSGSLWGQQKNLTFISNLLICPK